MNVQEASSFVARFEKGDYAPEEYATFLRWVRGCSIADLTLIADQHEALVDIWSLRPQEPTTGWVTQLENKLDKAAEKELENGFATPVRKLYTKQIGKRFFWIAAASLVVLVSSAAFWWFYHPIGTHGGIKEYANTVLSNTISTSRGEQRQVVLPDGSKVWLNASSTLKYPASFTGGERNVELTGEAFFEVAKNAVTPFRVKARDIQIQVLGTHFNVMAYPDESVSRTTLVEGAVKITHGNEAVLLQPGDQAEIAYPATGERSPISLIRGVDPQAVMAWKNGYLEFNNDDLQTVMRGISRTYDVDIQYEGEMPVKKFSGTFPIGEGLGQALKILELSGVHFKKNDKAIIVTK